jgi:hypothetical protein
MTLETAVRRRRRRQQQQQQQRRRRLTTEFSHVAVNADSGFPWSPKNQIWKRKIGDK